MKMNNISRIIFVCTGNICRSSMARGIALREAARRGFDVVISSAGTDACVGYPASKHAVTACSEIGIDITDHRGRQVREGVDDPETLFAVMTQRHAYTLASEYGVDADRIVILGSGVPDPFGQPLDVYRATCAALVDAIYELFDRIAPLLTRIDTPVIRDMTAQDAEAAAAIENKVFSDPWSVNSFLEEINNPLADVLAAELDGNICGYGCIISAGGISELPKICVAKEFRRRHTAVAILSELEKRAVSRGSDQLTLEVRISNEPAISLYKKLGFAEQGIRPDFYSCPDEDALIMTKELAAADTSGVE